ncbi:MAG TPA: plastocyanin/azurin family copper-binding protein [Solirubrobacteraceae bacterium]|jgi:mono/diheme cytochrome c family protein|nr:plastocyanin/azurin family copper-binding protein [Solirubrobacteraceae bacterium]
MPSIDARYAHDGPTRRARRPASRAASGALLAALALVAGGCSVKGEDNPNLIAGKQQFVAKCGSCHTLARANTKGIVGPNLDEAFRVAIAEGLRRNAVRGVVEGQIAIPNPEGAMPKELLTGAKAKDVAAYVAGAAARPGKDTGLLATAVEAPGSGKPAVETAGKLQIPANASGQLAYATNKAVGKPGPVLVEMPNNSGVSHNIAIEEGAHGATAAGSVLGASPIVSKGTATVKVTLKPGSYTFFCEVPGHRAAGMYGTLVVK